LNDLELVTVEEVVTLFREAGLPRHIQTIKKYCAGRWKAAPDNRNAVIQYSALS
jgi:hypothetical protein